ncbi:MAG TPA: ATPase, partial [Candidatus Mediterraneibacter tabaqchaliae]|nr:ATPase [Candidatus Mediterraneibacter tabaqchaliae]
CPPEGDAGTGMAATNSVAERTGNVSAGTSVFAMIVLEKDLAAVHKEIDMVTTPSGSLVAMAHANNCTSDLNAWVSLFREYGEAMGIETDMNRIFSVLYNKALEGDADCGGLLSYGFYSGESIVPVDEGRPLFARTPDSRFTLANFMRTHLYAALSTLKIGMDILVKEEKIRIDKILGHGGLFKTPGVGQRIMAAAMQAPVSVMETAGEGGAWGIALLASYAVRRASDETLEAYLDQKVFAGNAGVSMEPDPADVEGFEKYIERFKAGLSIEQEAVARL